MPGQGCAEPGHQLFQQLSLKLQDWLDDETVGAKLGEQHAAQQDAARRCVGPKLHSPRSLPTHTRVACTCPPPTPP